MVKKYIAALYSNGKMVTGSNHGEAFGKLSLADQDGSIDSGFYDPETGKFFTEEFDFYIKQIFLIRHAEAIDDHLTKNGISQARRTAQFLCDNYDLSEFDAINSPQPRCQHTAQIISNTTGLTFHSDPNYKERMDEETPTEFLQRIELALTSSPSRALIVTHSDVIVNFTERAIRHRISECMLASASLTFIDEKKLVFYGKDCYLYSNSTSL